MKHLLMAAVALTAAPALAGGQGPAEHTSYDSRPIVTTVQEPVKVVYLPGIPYQRSCCCDLSFAMSVAAGPRVIVTGGETHKFWVWGN